MGCGSAGAPGGPPASQPDAGRPPHDAAPAEDAPSDDGVPYPDPDWQTGTPESQGIDPAGLAAADAKAAALDSYCLLVIRHGVLVHEAYFNGSTATSTPSSWSIAKSYTSTTVGIAIGNGDIPSLDVRVSDYVPSWKTDERNDITLRNLVTMTSGLKWSILQDYIEMAEFAPDKSSFATGLDPDQPAGSKWVYHNGGVQMIEPLFRAATGETIEDYAREHLWSKIGMTATWAHDSAQHPTTFANVLTTCRDHARLGYLYLHGGKWKNEQVVPAQWVHDATTPSQAMNRGYGYLFWLNGQGPTISSTGSVDPNPLYDYAPADLFAAHGFGGQYIDVIPSMDMVVVRFAKDPTSVTSTNPIDIAADLAKDQTADAHKQIMTPIYQAVQ